MLQYFQQRLGQLHLQIEIKVADATRDSSRCLFFDELKRYRTFLVLLSAVFLMLTNRKLYKVGLNIPVRFSAVCHDVQFYG